MSRIEAVWAMADPWQRGFLVLLLICAVAQSEFIHEWARRPWFRVRAGRALMLKSSSFCTILWLTLVNTFFVYPYQEQVSFFAFLVVTVAVIYQLVTLKLSPRHPND